MLSRFGPIGIVSFRWNHMSTSRSAPCDLLVQGQIVPWKEKRVSDILYLSMYNQRLVRQTSPGLLSTTQGTMAAFWKFVSATHLGEQYERISPNGKPRSFKQHHCTSTSIPGARSSWVDLHTPLTTYVVRTFNYLYRGASGDTVPYVTDVISRKGHRPVMSSQHIYRAVSSPLTSHHILHICKPI